MNKLRAFGQLKANQSIPTQIQKTINKRENYPEITLTSHSIRQNKSVSFQPLPDCPILDRNSYQINYLSTIQSLNMREKLFKWIIAQCRLTLELRNQTIQHCLILFDKYYTCKGELTQSLCETQLTIISCLFISSKYQEIYAPYLTDFEYMTKYKFGGRQILAREIEILETVQYELNLSLASAYYHRLFGTRMPEWGILCYVSYPSKCNMKTLAICIQKIERETETKKSDEEIEGIVELVIEEVEKQLNK